MHFELTNIKVWAEDSATTLLLEAAQGAFDSSTGQVTIPHPTFKAMKQKTIDDRSSVSYVEAYVDGTARYAAAAAAAAHPAPPAGGQSKQAPVAPPPRFARRKMKMKSLSGRGVKLDRF
jgi:hypothetical protein